MKYKRHNSSCFFLFLIFIYSVNSLFGQSLISDSHEECTIGVASGTATADGRPLLWKTRDNSDSPNNEVKYNSSYPYKFISVCNAGSSTSSWMGVNEHGFSIINSWSQDLPANSTGPGNGTFQKDVLGNCKTVSEFQHYLDSTNITGRATQSNFGVIDSTGAAAIFETGGNVYYKFDANSSQNGYIIRTNFAINGGGAAGIERYNRSTALINNFFKGDSLSYKSIIRYHMRDFSDHSSNPISVPYSGNWSGGIPYGYIPCNYSICNATTVSSAVIQGVWPSELAGLTTMWTILGHPASTVSLPYWPVGNTPVEADGISTSKLCDKSKEIRSLLFDYSSNNNFIDTYKLRPNNVDGLWPCIFSLEDYIFSDTEEYMDSIRLLTTLPVSSMINMEAAMAGYTLRQLQSCLNSLITGVKNYKANALMQVYPNPANDIVTVNIDRNSNIDLTLYIYNIMGSLVKTETLKQNQQQINISELRNGIYILKIKYKRVIEKQKLIIQR